MPQVKPPIEPKILKYTLDEPKLWQLKQVERERSRYFLRGIILGLALSILITLMYLSFK